MAKVAIGSLIDRLDRSDRKPINKTLGPNSSFEARPPHHWVPVLMRQC